MAAVLLFSLAATVALAQDPRVRSTLCRESAVPLDAEHTSARLEGCGEQYPEDLLWHLDRIDQIGGSLDGSFDRRNAGAGSVVYVMDTGVMATHDEFASANGSRVTAGFDVSGSVVIGTSNCRSANKALAPCFSDFTELAAASHGTSVASIIAGRNVGVAPEATLISIRVMNERGLATTRTYLDGLDTIISHAWKPATPRFHTAIVNISGWVLERLTSLSSDPLPVVSFNAVEQKMRDMIHGVDAQGRPDRNGRRFLFVVAGNNLDGGCGRSGVVDRFPAILGKELDGIITVGGMTADNIAWSGTCRGGVEVLAPAQSIFSATITANDHYRGRRPNLRSGTSFAAPIISGIAARLLADRPELTPEQLEAWIESTPSRIDAPDAKFADGKVGYVRSLAPAPAVASRITLEP
ncbi:MAG TPA: S8 family serine peptidase [Thermoanaerobaculia bacterium]|nr:S8 family serine peptidase [Thermoanaerobaculia bacterium]